VSTVLSSGSPAAPAAGSSLEGGAITANSAISHELFEPLWQTLTTARRERHERIGLGAPARSSVRRWHMSRADGLRRPLSRTLEQCGSRGAALGCGCPKKAGQPQKLVRRGCHRRLWCDACGAEYRSRTYQRVRRSVVWWLERLRSEWAARGGSARQRARTPQVYMVTLTIPHVGSHSVEERAAALDAAWRWVSRGRVDGHWTRPCLAVWEWTPGSDGRGHPHLHVVVPAHWLEYSLIWGDWRDACEAVGLPQPRALEVTLPGQRLSGGRMSGPGIDAMARSAARYVAKYVSSASKLSMGAEQWAHLGALMLGRRTLRASVGSRSRSLPGFWQAYERPRCQCCGDTFSLVPVVHQWTGKAHEPLDESVTPVIPTTIECFYVGIMDSLRCP